MHTFGETSVDGEIVTKLGKSKGRRFPVGQGQTVTIGRGLKADIQVIDDGLSRVHCSIENRGHMFFVRDLESANGTYLNGKAVAAADAYDGDEISIGLAVLSLVGPKRPKRPERPERYE